MTILLPLPDTPNLSAAGPRPKRPVAKTKLGGVAVVCAKCAKRQGVRPKAIRALLQDAYRAMSPAPAKGEGQGSGKGKRRKLCVVESGCLGPCPKRAVAVATGASLAAGRVLLLDPKAGAEGARAALLPEFGPNGPLAAQPNEAAPRNAVPPTP